MRKVVVDMRNVLFSDAIAKSLQEAEMGFSVYPSGNPNKTLQLCCDVMADILIAEVTAHTPWSMEERMKLRNAAKERSPALKIVLVVDENTDRKLADRVRKAKKEGLIDSFLYGSVSSTYLSAVVDAL